VIRTPADFGQAFGAFFYMGQVGEMAGKLVRGMQRGVWHLRESVKRRPRIDENNCLVGNAANARLGLVAPPCRGLSI
jgi:hypothetical protein